jgi:RHS repeat-associated protein
VVALYRWNWSDEGKHTVTLEATYSYDPWGKLLSVKSAGGSPISATLTTNIANVNPFRYRGYYYDSETGFYYLRSRYYDPAISRFINADEYASTGQGFIGTNMFAYCNNNPVNLTDPLGLWTISFSFSISGILGLGASFSIGFAFDSKGNFDWQYSYSAPGVDSTATVGAVSYGAGVAFQYTNAATVYDLYGSATYVGGSVGNGTYVGVDLISLSHASDLDSTIDGFQLSAGIGGGIMDVHVTESYTRSLEVHSGASGGSRSRNIFVNMCS